MSVGAIEAGKAFVRLMVNDEALVKGLKSAQAKVKMFASATGTLGRQLLAASAAMATPLIAGTKAYADFERQMAQVSTMLDDPAQYMGQFSEGIKKLAVQFGEGTDTLAKGLYDILSASVAPAQAMDVLTASVMAAKAGLSDTGTAANAIVTIMNAYQMQADQAGQISDWLFQVIKRGQTTFEEFAPNVGNMATIAATAGVSLNELGAVFATITRNGIQTEEAVTAINAILSGFLSPSKEAAELAQQLGINLSVSALQGDGLLKTFQSLMGLPPDIIADLFPNIRALKGVLPALRNLEGFSDDMLALGQAAGSTDEAYQKLAKGISAQFDRTKQAVLIAANEIGAALGASVGEGLEYVKELAKATADWIKENRELVVILGKTALVAAAVGGAMVVMSQAALVVSGAIGAVTASSAALYTAFTFLAAHPVVAAMAAVGVVLGAVAIKGELAAAAASKLAREQQAILDAGNKQRSVDLDRMARLEALAEKEKLTNSEAAEAKGIIAAMTKTYGDLGIVLDSTTGRLDGVAAGFSKMTSAMQKQKRMELKGAIAGMDAQITAAEQNISPGIMNPVDVVSDIAGVVSGRGATKYNAIVKQRTQELEALGKQREAMVAEYQRLADGDTSVLGAPNEPLAVAGNTPAAEVASNALQEITDAKTAADFKQKLDERAHQARIQMIEDEGKRELATIKARHDAEMAELKESQKGIESMADGQAKMDAGQKAAEDVASLERVQRMEVSVVTQEQERKRQAEATRAEEDKARNRLSLAQEVEDLTIQKDYQGLDQQLAQIEAQRKRSLAEASSLGLSVDQVNKKFDLMGQIAKAGEGTQQAAQLPKITGTFSALQASRMGGAGSVEKEQLVTQKRIAAASEKTVRVLEAGASLV